MADKHVSFRFQPQVIEHLRKLAAVHDRTMTGYLERLILSQPLTDTGLTMPGAVPQTTPAAPHADRLAAARALLTSVSGPTGDDDDGRTVVPDEDWLASGPQPRRGK